MNLKFLAAIIMAATISTVSQAQTPQGAKAPEEKTTAVNDGSDFTIEKDETIDGVRYIMIRADDGVEVNGVSIHMPE